MPVDFDVILVATYDCTEMGIDEIQEADKEIIELMILGGFQLLDRDMRNSEIRCLTFEKGQSYNGVPIAAGHATTKPQFLS